MADGLGLDAWWDEPAYKAAQGTFTERGTFILAKLRAHDAAKLQDVLADVYRADLPDPADMTKFEWEVILCFMGRPYVSITPEIASPGSAGLFSFRLVLANKPDGRPRPGWLGRPVHPRPLQPSPAGARGRRDRPHAGRARRPPGVPARNPAATRPGTAKCVTLQPEPCFRAGDEYTPRGRRPR